MNLFSSFNVVLNVCWNTHDSARNFAISPGSSESNVNVDVFHNSKSAFNFMAYVQIQKPLNTTYCTAHTGNRNQPP